MGTWHWNPNISFQYRGVWISTNWSSTFQIQINPSPCIPALSTEQIRLCVHHLAKQDFPNPEQRAPFRIWECWALCLWKTNTWSCTQKPPRDDKRMRGRKGIMDVTLRSGCSVHPWREVPATTKLLQELCLQIIPFCRKMRRLIAKSFGFGNELNYCVLYK